jgi:hypothetical protein
MSRLRNEVDQITRILNEREPPDDAFEPRLIRIGGGIAGAPLQATIGAVRLTGCGGSYRLREPI